jgi:ATP-dependent Clp protease protease subunit
LILSRSAHPLGGAGRHDDDDDDHEWVAVPLVVDKRGKSEELVDLYSRMLRDRVVFVGGPVARSMAQVVTAQLLYLANEDPKAEISMYVNSPGGSVSAGLGIVDTMRFIPCPVATYIIGQAASMGSVIACSGTKGRRFALPHAENLMHQPLIGGVIEGQATDLEIHAKHILRLREKLYQLYSENTGQTKQRIHDDCDRDKWLNAQEMLEYGLIDGILERLPGK